MDYKKQRLSQLRRCIPDIFNYNTVLYIGAKHSRSSLLGTFIDHRMTVDAVEAHTPNAKEVEHYFPGIRIFNIELQKFTSDIMYDIVFWFHGPEHLEQREIGPILEKLYKITNKILVLGCPYGIYEQGAVGGNEFERHRSHLIPVYFQKKGFRTNTLGPEDVHGSHILSWKRRADA